MKNIESTMPALSFPVPSPSLARPAMNAPRVMPYLVYGAALTLCHGWQNKPAGETLYGIGETPEIAESNGRMNFRRWAHSLDIATPRGNVSFLDSLDDKAEREAYQDENERSPLVTWHMSGERVA